MSRIMTIVPNRLASCSISTVIVAFYQFNKISTETTNKGDELLVDARISPKVLGIACFNTSGYAIVSVDSPITVPIYYEVKYGLDEIASGFVSTNITDVGNIYFNATIVTLDEQLPQAQAMLVKDGIITALGTNAEINKLKTDNILSVDLKGATILPGLRGQLIVLASTTLTPMTVVRPFPPR